MYVAATWIIFVANAILAVIMIARLYAMYQGSRKVLMILIAIFLTVYIAVGLVSGISEGHSSIKELILSGTHQYILQEEERSLVLMILVVCILTMCEVIALCFALWIAVKRCRELRRYSAGGFVEGFLGALMKSHIIHFASFVVMSCFQLGLLSHRITGDPYFLEYRVYSGLSQTFSLLQLFVLGPRLIIDVREYHAKLIADSDAPIGMTSIAFRERVHVSTSSTV
ncbi:uncharacterized protein EDB93DRAFT_641233 [Suillus bovinus]|uniref:uncharacterized protein n=1 Tax=Suillus bovinus TaxID=48563 RepID=UPI001B85B95D|nr:uncharacterized protein EDB93DRAFT_641233 [Suillus bovinus]KAG2141176.1 hypothetical protein EDB93DRAFT_641233 [Suillus bovinus]